MTQSRVIARDEFLRLDDQTGFQFNLDGVSLTIGGTVQLMTSKHYQGLYGVRVETSSFSSSFEISSSGKFLVISNNIDEVFVTGYLNVGFSGRFKNSGILEVHSNVFATGYEARYTSTVFQNEGRLIVDATRVATGAIISGGGAMMNSGVIEARSQWSSIGVTIEFGNDAQGGVNPKFINSGSIIADAGPMGQSIGVLTYQGGIPQTDQFVNAGLISADIAFYVSEDPDPTSRPTRQSILNSGTIEGSIFLGRGDDEVVNTGFINGDIDLGEGRDVFDGRLGQITGTVWGGAGGDRLYGGSEDNVFQGEVGEDIIFGGAGDDFIDAGRDRDVIDGGEGFDTLSYNTAAGAVLVDLEAGEARDSGRDLVTGIENVIGSRFGDRLFGSAGAEVLESREGADTLDGRAGDDMLVGGQGADTLTGGAGNDAFVFSRGDGQDVVTDFLAGGADDRLLIYGYMGYLELRQQGADTLVVLSDADVIRLVGVTASSLTPNDFLFDPTPLQTATTSTVLTPILTRENFVVQVGETLVFDGQGRPVQIHLEPQLYSALPVPSVYNAGTISVTVSDPYSGAVGILFADARRLWIDSVTVNAAGALIEAHSKTDLDALGIGGSYLEGSIYNAGTIRVTSDFGNAYGIRVSPDVLVNTGTIEVYAGQMAVGTGVGLDVFSNTGQILVHGGLTTLSSASTGLTFSGRFVTNAGLILVTEGTADGFSIGVNFSRSSGGDSTLLNTGIIEADYAIYEMTDMYVGNSSLVYNTGELRGKVAMLYGRSEIYNAGLITGETRLFDGNDYFDGRRGSQGAVFGEEGADVLLGGVGADQLDGGAGEDVIYGGGGNDRLTGGAGADRFGFIAGDGHDVITDFLVGSDSIQLTGYLAYQSVVQDGADTVINLSATDSLRLLGVQASTITNGSFLFNAAGPAAGGVFPSAPTPPTVPGAPPPMGPIAAGQGTAGADTLTGDSGANSLFGQGGDDQLSGGGGDDILRGGGGNDTLRGGAGDDDIDGGSGHDVMFVTGARNEYRILDGGDHFILKGPEGHDRLVNVEEIRFSDGESVSLASRYGGESGPQVQPWEPDVDDGRIVSPPADDHVFLPDGPLVLPDLTDKGLDDDPLVLPGADTPGGRFAFAPDDAGLVVMGRHGPVLLDIDLLHAGGSHDPWA